MRDYYLDCLKRGEFKQVQDRFCVVLLVVLASTFFLGLFITESKLAHYDTVNQEMIQRN